MGLPLSIREGGLFLAGTVFEVFEKTDRYKNREGEWVSNKHWTVDIKKKLTLRGKDREVSQLVTFTQEQVKNGIHSSFMKLEGTLVVVPVRAYYEGLVLDGDGVLNLDV